MRIAAKALTLSALLTGAVFMTVHAKLPPLGEEAKAKAAETAAKTAWTDKVGAYKLCEAMNRTAEGYRSATKAAGKEAPASVETPACSDPGPYAAPVPAAAPLEAAGAHSPATMATSPPNSKATATELGTQKK
jgi:hypothetical protein